MDRLQTPPIVTSDFVYLRLIGDRRLSEDQFGKIQIERSNEIKKWSDKLIEIRQNEKNVKMAIVAANNHYGGFGPGTVNMFREMMEMESLSFENVDLQKVNQQMGSQFNNWRTNERAKQTSISDFV